MAGRNGSSATRHRWHTKREPSHGDKKAALIEHFNIVKPDPSRMTGDKRRAYKELKEYLGETWAQQRGLLADQPRLTPRQVEFARLWAANGRKGILKCMQKAGYKTQNDGALYQDGQRLLANERIQQLVNAFEIEEKAKVVLQVSDVAEYLKKIADAAFEAGDFANANRSMENLGKHLGMFVEKKEVTHRVVHSREELDAKIIEYQQILEHEVLPNVDETLKLT
jgi:hypothetical protein